MIAGHEKVDSRVIKAVRSILDYTYMAQYPALSELDLRKMEDLLTVFHQNKEIFISNKLWGTDHLHIPKLHGLHHFMDDTQSGGTPESLHIDIVMNCAQPPRTDISHAHGPF